MRSAPLLHLFELLGTLTLLLAMRLLGENHRLPHAVQLCLRQLRGQALWRLVQLLASHAGANVDCHLMLGSPVHACTHNAQTTARMSSYGAKPRPLMRAIAFSCASRSMSLPFSVIFFIMSAFMSIFLLSTFLMPLQQNDSRKTVSKSTYNFSRRFSFSSSISWRFSCSITSLGSITDVFLYQKRSFPESQLKKSDTALTLLPSSLRCHHRVTDIVLSVSIFYYFRPLKLISSSS